MYLCKIVEAEEVVNSCCRQIFGHGKIEIIGPACDVWNSAVVISLRP